MGNDGKTLQTFRLLGRLSGKADAHLLAEGFTDSGRRPGNQRLIKGSLRLLKRFKLLRRYHFLCKLISQNRLGFMDAQFSAVAGTGGTGKGQQQLYDRFVPGQRHCYHRAFLHRRQRSGAPMSKELTVSASFAGAL